MNVAALSICLGWWRIRYFGRCLFLVVAFLAEAEEDTSNDCGYQC
jgi:hypothetical protein